MKKLQIKYNIIYLIIPLLIFSSLIAGTFSWLLIKKETGGQLSFGVVSGKIIGNIYPLNSENSLLVPGDTILNPIEYKSTTNNNNSTLVDQFLRVRLVSSLNTSDNTYLTIIFEDENLWYMGASGYYYYADVIHPNEQIKILEGIKVSNHLSKSYSGKETNLAIEVDTIQAQHNAYQEAWNHAPVYWVENVAIKYTNGTLL